MRARSSGSPFGPDRERSAASKTSSSAIHQVDFRTQAGTPSGGGPAASTASRPAHSRISVDPARLADGPLTTGSLGSRDMHRARRPKPAPAPGRPRPPLPPDRRVWEPEPPSMARRTPREGRTTGHERCSVGRAPERDLSRVGVGPPAQEATERSPGRHPVAPVHRILEPPSPSALRSDEGFLEGLQGSSRCIRILPQNPEPPGGTETLVIPSRTLVPRCPQCHLRLRVHPASRSARAGVTSLSGPRPSGRAPGRRRILRRRRYAFVPGDRSGGNGTRRWSAGRTASRLAEESGAPNEEAGSPNVPGSRTETC